jgi:hypothetical protein
MKTALLALMALPVLSACGGGGGSGPSTLHLGLTHSLVQKGPFSQGADVTIQELGPSYEPSGKIYSTKTVDDFGAFDFSGDVGSPFVEIITTGYYFDEVAGALSSGPLSLRVITDLSASSVNINILTTLAEDRIKYLVVSGGKSYDDAKAQAQAEILRVFEIPDEIAAGLSGFESMDISQPGVDNGVLLAISAVLQGQHSVAELSEEIAKIASDLESDGTLDSAALVSDIKTSAVGLDLGAIHNNLQNRYDQLGLSNSIPDFEKYVDSDGDGIINAWDYTLTSPSGTINASSPTFQWSASELPGASYHFQISANEDFSTILEEASALTTTQYPLQTKLTNLGSYYWRVLITGTSLAETNWADAQSFTLDLGAVMTSSPADGSHTNLRAPAFTWAANAVAATYQLVIATDSVLASPVLTKSGLSGTQYTLSSAEQLPATASTAYYWAVTPIDANGVAGAPSPIHRFVLDTTAPSGTVVINGGQAYATSANVTLTLSASDASPVLQMRFAESASALAAAAYVDYVGGAALTLSAGDGPKTVFAQFKDAAGNESTPVESSITIETGVVYVATSGNDSQPGTRDLPKASIQAAIDLAGTLADASQVKVAAGTYTLTASLSVGGGVMLLGGFSPSDWNVRDPAAHRTRITLAGNPAIGQTVIATAYLGDSNGKTGIDGFTLEVIAASNDDYAYSIEVSGNATLSNNVIHSTNSHGIAYGVQVYGGAPKLYNNLIYVDGATQNAVVCFDGSTPLIMNNDLIALLPGGAGIYSGEFSHAQILNNLVANFAMVISEDTIESSRPSTVQNNDAWGFTTFYYDGESNTGYSIASLGAGLSGMTVSGNLAVDLTASIADADGADNDLTTTDDNDWRLLGTAPASVTQGGVDLSAQFTTDLAGVTRSAPWTIGAYEF